MSTNLTVKRAVYKDIDKFTPGLRITFEDKGMPDAVLGLGVSQGLKRGLGVYLGPAYEDILPTFQAGDGGATTIRGYTQNETIIQLADRFVRDTNGIEGGEYREGEVLIGDD